MEKGAAKPQTQALQAPQGRADLRALTQPGRQKRQAPKETEHFRIKEHV